MRPLSLCSILVKKFLPFLPKSITPLLTFVRAMALLIAGKQGIALAISTNVFNLVWRGRCARVSTKIILTPTTLRMIPLLLAIELIPAINTRVLCAPGLLLPLLRRLNMRLWLRC